MRARADKPIRAGDDQADTYKPLVFWLKKL